MLAGNLLLREQQLREQSAKVGLQRTNMAFAPTLSFVANNSYNQYNPDFTLFGGNWIQSQYIGFRLGFNLPNANTIANRAKAKYDYQLTLKNGEQTRLQTTSELQQLALDWEKAATQLNTNREVLDLQRNIYLKHQNLYREGLQSIDQTLSSFSAMVNAEYSFIAAQVSIALATAKIDLNNKFNSK